MEKGSEMRKIEITVTDDNEISINRYTDLAVQVYKNGNMASDEREQLRSYAIEIVNKLFRDNDELFRYAGFMREVYEKWRKS
jgi:hypothetical protein